MRVAKVSLLFLLALQIYPSSLQAAKNKPDFNSKSVPIQPYAQISDADSTQIDEQAAIFFITLQAEGAFAAFSMMPVEGDALMMVKGQMDQLDYLCPAWDSVSTGKIETLSHDVQRRKYYTIGSNCVFEWTLIFRRSGSDWILQHVAFYSPEKWP